MFDRFNGLPMHVLVVHAAVVFTPLAALLGILFAAVRSWRWLLRWPLVGSAVVASGAVVVAVQSGEAFRSRLGLPPALIGAHASAGNRLRLAMALYLVLAAGAAVALGGPTGLRSGKGARAGVSPRLQGVVAVVLGIGSLALAYQVFRTGESGAKVAWAGR